MTCLLWSEFCSVQNRTATYQWLVTARQFPGDCFVPFELI